MKNLIVFDIETTGLDKSKDQIIQISAIKVNTENHTIIDEINYYVQPVGSYEISIAAYLKHRITPKFLSDKPFFKDIAENVIEFFKDCDILTYNGNSFDIPFFKAELNKYGFDFDFLSVDCYDAFQEERRRHGISLENTYKKYKGKTMQEAGLEAHNALSDVKATYTVFCAQQKIQKYGPEKMYGEDNIITDMDFDGQIKPCFNFGKHRGVSLEYIAKYKREYLEWIVSNDTKFTESTKEYVRRYL